MWCARWTWILGALCACTAEGHADLRPEPPLWPDVVHGHPDALVVRLRDDEAPTSSRVHRALSRLASDSLSATEAMGGSGEAWPPTAGDSDSATWGPVDRCGNPTRFAFVTPGDAGEPEGEARWTADEIWAPAAREAGALLEGTWDVSLTETRLDGRLDVVVTLYPAPDRQVPGLSGHLLAVAQDAAGLPWAVPLWVSADRVQLTLSGLVGRIDEGEEGVESYAFPVLDGPVPAARVEVSFLPDPDCEAHARAAGLTEVPVGCAPDEGLPSSLSVTSESALGAAVVAEAMDHGRDRRLLEVLVEGLAWQLGAQAICAEPAAPRVVEEGPVEVLVCPGLAPQDCVTQQAVEAFLCAPTPAEPLEWVLPEVPSLLTGSWGITPPAVGATATVSGPASLRVDAERVRVQPPGGGVASLARGRSTRCPQERVQWESDGDLELVFLDEGPVEVVVARRDDF